jgi:hypothetical protein
VPVYYDLKRMDWEPDFEALEKLDLTKVKLCGLVIRTCQQDRGLSLFEKLVFCKKT